VTVCDLRIEPRTDYWAAPQNATSALKRGPAAAAAREPQEEAMAAPHSARVHRGLLEFGVFGLGLFQDGDVGVGVFPECGLICAATGPRGV